MCYRPGEHGAKIYPNNGAVIFIECKIDTAEEFHAMVAKMKKMLAFS